MLLFALSVPVGVVIFSVERVAELEVPVAGVLASELRDSFEEPREGARRHGAIDIDAPEGTAVVAAAGGIVGRIARSPLGGLGVTVIDRGRRRCHYYAHLARYTIELEEGRTVARGQVLGFVGSTGNASSEAPHLHFAVFPLRSDGTCRLGTPLNPHPLLTER